MELDAAMGASGMGWWRRPGGEYGHHGGGRLGSRQQCMMLVCFVCCVLCADCCVMLRAFVVFVRCLFETKDTSHENLNFVQKIN